MTFRQLLGTISFKRKIRSLQIKGEFYEICYNEERQKYLEKAWERLERKEIPDSEKRKANSAIWGAFFSAEHTSMYDIGQDVKSMIWYYKRKIKKILKGDFTPVDPFYEFIDALRELGYSEQESEEIIHGK